MMIDKFGISKTLSGPWRPYCSWRSVGTIAASHGADNLTNTIVELRLFRPTEPKFGGARFLLPGKCFTICAPVGRTTIGGRHDTTRGGSSAGRALRSQCRGRGFDPLPLHQISPALI